MVVGHEFDIDGVNYCICDIREIAGRKFASAIANEETMPDICFFEMKEEENGTSLIEINEPEVFQELLRIFSDVDETKID